MIVTGWGGGTHGVVCQDKLELDGVVAVAEGLRSNRSLTSLNLEGKAKLTRQAAIYIGQFTHEANRRVGAKGSFEKFLVSA